jgi:hypothetical protein
MEYEGRGKNLKKSDVGCSLKKMVQKKKRTTPFRRQSLTNLKLNLLLCDCSYLLIMKLNHCIVELNALDSGLRA